MQDPLNAIRRLYGEADPGDVPSPEVQAEANTLAAVKAGLDALPPQRPDPSTLDAVFAAAGADALEPIRAVYQDETAPSDSDEAEAFAELKAGLDALPPQRPDAQTLDAIFAAAEADVLAPVRAVYEGEDVAADWPETAVLAALKSGLDALPAQRPDAATLDAVFAAAGVEHESRPRAADRAPKRLVTRRRTVVALSAAFVLMLALTSGLWLGQDNDLPSLASAESDVLEESVADDQAETPAQEKALELSDADAQFDAAAPSVSRESVAGAIANAAPPPREIERAAPTSPPPPSATARTDVAPAFASALAPAPSRPEADLTDEVVVPEAALAESFADQSRVAEGLADLVLADETLPLDDGDEALQVLYLRMQELQTAQAGLGWDEPPVALGAAPDSVPVATGWMKVRVER